MKRKNKTGTVLSVLLPLFAAALFISGIGNGLELWTQDLRFRLRGHKAASGNILIAAIDDSSVEGYGSWPWNRNIMAVFLELIRSAPPAELVLDITYTEPSEEFAAYDRLLARAAEACGNVYFPFFCITGPDNMLLPLPSEGHPEPAEELLDRISLGSPADYPGADFINVTRSVMPIPGFAAAAAGSGYVNSPPDPDGVNRRIPLVMRYGDRIIPNVAFDAALNFLDADRDTLQITPGRHITVETPEKVIMIPVDRRMRMLVNHPGGFTPEVFRLKPFIRLVQEYSLIRRGGESELDTARIGESLKFVGLTATGTVDHGVTPFSPHFPMVAYLASAASNIIEGNFIRVIPAWVSVFLILLAGLAASRATLAGSAPVSVIINAGILGALFGVSLLLFHRDILIPLAHPALSVILSYAGVTVYRVTGEQREKRAIKNMFSRYVSSQVVNELLKDPDKAGLGGGRKRLTVFFSDIRGFTSMSEKLPPEEVVSILNEYLTEMIDVIFRYNGTLDKFMGDAVMAVWGAPVPQKDHARLAVEAAWGMLGALKRLQEKWEGEGRLPISVGMGINTGDVVIGNMGSDEFADYTVIGDNVNLAARLEQNAGPGQLLISETTYEEVKDIVEVKRLEPMSVKGKSRPVEVYEVTSVKH